MGPGQSVLEGGVFSKPQALGLLAGNVPINLAQSLAFEVTANGGITILNPTGAPNGAGGIFGIAITQGPNGSAPISFGPQYLLPPGAEFSTGAGDVDYCLCSLQSNGTIIVSLTRSSQEGQAGVAFNANTAVASTVLTAANISGADDVVLNLSGTLTGAANAQLPTAAALIAAIPGASIGLTYKLRIINNSSGAFAWTVTTNTGWTLTGTMTIAQAAYRDFIVTITGAATATLQNVGGGTA